MLYGCDARIPTEAAPNASLSLHMLDIADYRTELVIGLTTAWNSACTCITKAQKNMTDMPNLQYIRSVTELWFTCLMRCQVHRKLSLPYHGPYRIIDIDSNYVSVKSVDRPDEQLIRVNMDRITLCPAEVPLARS